MLVDFTASWCLTCNTVVKPALDSRAIRDKLQEIGGVALLADYSGGAAHITDELNRLEHPGVPLLLVYPKNPSQAPIVLRDPTPFEPPSHYRSLVLEALGVLGIEFGRGRRAPAHRDQVVLRGIDPDAVEPCIERAVAPKRGERPIRLDECFLCNILYFDRVPDEPGQQPRQFTLVLRHQQLESMLVAPLGPLDQLSVEFPLIHPPPSLTKRYRASVRSCPQAAAVYRTASVTSAPVQLQTGRSRNSSVSRKVIAARAARRFDASGARPSSAESPPGRSSLA